MCNVLYHGHDTQTYHRDVAKVGPRWEAHAEVHRIGILELKLHEANREKPTSPKCIFRWGSEHLITKSALNTERLQSNELGIESRIASHNKLITQLIS